MIQTRPQYLDFLECDRLALKKIKRKPNLIGDEVWKFQRALRKLEYLTNKKRNFFDQISFFVTRLRFHRLSLLCGFSIPINTFGPGLSIAHRGTIVVNSKARIGANCRINACVNIGASGGIADAVPTIGDNVYIGPGAKIFGKIRIADDIQIGANAVVNRSFTDPGVVIAGVPAKVIKENHHVTSVQRNRFSA